MEPCPLQIEPEGTDLLLRLPAYVAGEFDEAEVGQMESFVTANQLAAQECERLHRFKMLAESRALPARIIELIEAHDVGPVETATDALHDAAFKRQLVQALRRNFYQALVITGDLDQADELLQRTCEVALASYDRRWWGAFRAGADGMGEWH